MRNIILTVITALLLTGAFTGCKTTEANYRNAYELAKAKTDSYGGDIDSTIYTKIRRSGRSGSLTMGNDTLQTTTIAIGFPEDCGASRETVHKYNVVVAEFKQIFNARQMRNRLMEEGYDGALVINNREPLYYVVSESCDMLPDAAEAFHRIEKEKTVRLKDGFPYILIPAHLAR